MKRVALYLRVSTDGQQTEHQRRQLEEVAKHRGWEVVQVYEDAGVSGAKGRDKRPAFDALQKDATRKKFDMIAAWSVDRLGRSLQDLLAFLDELKSVGCDLYLHQQAVDTTTPAGRALFQMMGVFAEFERSMIRERVMAGLATAKAKGKTFGRPRVDGGMERRIAELHAKGYGKLKIAKEVGCGVSTVQRVVGSASAISVAS
ncbi:MAG: recombinase family protein [Rhodanobacteraceae bacterium]|nr:recombinase family protein [Rhodanobacteraceae bacterium]